MWASSYTFVLSNCLYGRFAAAATWYKVLTGKDADTEKFAEQNPDFDISLLKVIEKAILKL